MKLLHTSDWHLGKRLYGKSRLAEQREVLDEIAEICKREKIDVMLLAGDVFDTFVPVAEAEELFYETLTRLSAFCVPVVIAGNHDDAERLNAPRELARINGIVLAGGEARKTSGVYGGKPTEIETGDGFVRITRGGETLNLALVPYPTAAKLMDIAGAEDYSSAVSRELCAAQECFTDGGINVTMSHLFVTGSPVTDERDLGGTKQLPKELLGAENCVYTALGHIHKPMTVSKSNNAYYSGSILPYSFDETTEKRVIVADTDGKKTDVKSVPLSPVKRLYKVVAESEEQILEGLDSHADGYVYIEYSSPRPLSPGTASAMKKHPAFCYFEAKPREAAEETVERRSDKSDRELFEAFYEAKRRVKPTAELTDIFLKAVSGEEL